MDINVLDWLERQAEITPDQACYSDNGCTLTFAEVMNDAKGIGAELCKCFEASDSVQKSAGYERSPVCVLAGRKAGTIETFLGVVYSGHPYAPVDTGLPDERIESILHMMKPPMIIADEEMQDRSLRLSGGHIPVVVNNELRKNGPLTDEETDALQRERDSMVETDPLYIIFTSGSTGIPKGVVTSHHSLMTYIDAYNDVMRLNSHDILGNQSPLDYIAAIRDIYLPLRTGCSTYIIPKEYFMEPDILFEAMNEHHVTAAGWSVSALSVPVSLGAFSTDDSPVPQYLRKVCFSGSVMPGRVLRKWQLALPECEFVNQYGPTEATASCTYYRVSHLAEENERIPIGRPYRGYKVFLLKDDGTVPEEGEEGEICVAGPILALGYYNEPERTRRDFTVNPLNSSYPERIYHTGDYGAVLPDGNLAFHGRKDRQIKHMGHRVELDEIDTAAMRIEGVAESCTIYNTEREQIWLFYSGTVSKRDIIITLRQYLPGFMIPRKIQNLASLPRLANGKIDMKALHQLSTPDR